MKAVKVDSLEIFREDSRQNTDTSRGLYVNAAVWEHTRSMQRAKICKTQLNAL